MKKRLAKKPTQPTNLNIMFLLRIRPTEHAATALAVDAAEPAKTIVADPIKQNKYRNLVFQPSTSTLNPTVDRKLSLIAENTIL